MELLLRKLTRKSKLGFGMYKDLTVGDLLAIESHRYLRWVYYNCSMITFFDDILNEIGLFTAWRIGKPGKKPELNDELNEFKNEFMSTSKKAYNKSKSKRNSKARRGMDVRREQAYFSKARMVRRNHGHSDKPNF